MASAQHPVDAPHRHTEVRRPGVGPRWRLPLLHLLLGLAWIVVLAWLAGGVPGDGTRPWWLVALAAVLATTLLMALAVHRLSKAAAGAVAADDTGGGGSEGLHALMQLLPDGVLLLVDGRIAQVNAAAGAALGFAPGALAGRPANGLLAEADRPLFDAWLASPDRQRAMPLPTLRLQRSDGSGFRAALTATPARHAGAPCTLLLMRDLGEAERMRDELAAGNRELQALAARVFTLQEDERRAISRELHDDIGQSVTAMKMAAASALDEPDAQRRRDDIEDIQVLADATLERLRDISILLRPPQLDALGLEAALRWHAQRRLHDAGIVPELRIDALPQRPVAEVEQACFRIAQEALTNILRHAAAGRVTLALRGDDGGQGLHLRVEDDGRGFAPGAAGGLGLVIMRERALGVGGRLDVQAAPGRGTRIEAWLPYALPPAQDAAPGAMPVPPGEG